MGMTVKELITRLLDEPMNEEACLQTTDTRFIDPQNKEGKCIFHITDVEHWGGIPFINFEDWRPGRFIKKGNEALEDIISRENYEQRLKADMVAMLTEIQLEIEECVDGAEGSPQFEQGVTNARVQVVELIQQKINALKAEGARRND